MKRTLAASAMIGALAVASPALADTTLTPGWSERWAGPYIGVNIGHAWGSARTSAGAGSTKTGYDGVLGGAQLGYNFQADRLVFGLETDIQGSGQSGTSSFGTGVRNSLRWFGTTRARIGLDMGPFLPYATGGIVYGDNRLRGSGPGFTVSNTRTHLGWTAGGGLEYAAFRNISLRGEYLYADMGRKSYGAGTSVRPHFHAIRFGVNLRF